MNSPKAKPKTLFREEAEKYQKEQKRTKSTSLKDGLVIVGATGGSLLALTIIRIIFGWLPDIVILLFPVLVIGLLYGLYRIIISLVRSEKQVVCPECGTVHEIFKKERLYICPECWTLLHMGKDGEVPILFLNCAYCGHKAAITNDHGEFVCPNCGVTRSSIAKAAEWKTTSCPKCEELVPQEALYCTHCDQILKPLPTYDKDWEVGKDAQGHFHFARMLLAKFSAEEAVLENRFNWDNPRSGKQPWPNTFLEMPPMLTLARAQRSLEEALQEPELSPLVGGLLPEIDVLYARLLVLEIKMIQWAEGPDKVALVVGADHEKGTCLDIFSQGPHILARKRIEKILGAKSLQSIGGIGRWKVQSLIDTKIHTSVKYKDSKPVESLSVELAGYAGLISEAKRFAEWTKKREGSEDLLVTILELEEHASDKKKGDPSAIEVPTGGGKVDPVEKIMVATRTAAPAYSASTTSERPGSSVKPGKSKRGVGYVFVTCGSLMLILALILAAGLAFSILNYDSAVDNVGEDIGGIIICAPIFGVGLGLLLFGISKLRGQKKKPEEKQFGGYSSETDKKGRAQVVVGAELITEGNYLDKKNTEEMIEKGDIIDLIDALDSAENHSARYALLNQHKQGNSKVKEALLSAMSHKSAKVRAQSIQLLKEPSIGLKDQNVLNLFIQALQDESADVRYESAYALADIRSAEATRPLMELLDDESEPVREYVVYALGEIGDIRAADALKKRVPIETERVRMRIGHALKKIKAVWG